MLNNDNNKRLAEIKLISFTANLFVVLSSEQ